MQKSKVRLHKRVKPGLKLDLVWAKFSTSTKYYFQLDLYGYFVFILNFALNNLNFATYFMKEMLV